MPFCTCSFQLFAAPAAAACAVVAVGLHPLYFAILAVQVGHDGEEHDISKSWVYFSLPYFKSNLQGCTKKRQLGCVKSPLKQWQVHTT